MNNSIKAVTFILIYNFFQSTHAQDLNRPYEFGFAAGISVYQGDLTPNPLGSFETMQFAINLHAGKVLNRFFIVRANFIYSRLRGDDKIYDHPEYRQQRNFNFHSPLSELSVLLLYNPLGKNYSSKGFSTYFFAGAGLSLLAIKRDHSAFNAAYFGDGSDLPARIAVDDAHITPRVIPAVPVGVGIRYNLSERFAVNAETSYRFLFTDYLDGFSKAAQPALNDHYHTTTVGLIYRTAAKSKGSKNKNGCPVMKY